MALIKCPECTREISNTAPACPHCGYVMNAHESETFEKKVCSLSAPALAADDKKLDV